MHHVTPELLWQVFHWLKRSAAPGVDGVTWHDYEENLEARLEDLHARVHRGSYHPLPSRRKYIAKADGRMRPLGIAALEDKIVQRAVVEVLNAIYEQDFWDSHTDSGLGAGNTTRSMHWPLGSCAGT
jgi:retron-type reverse transcriptase